MQNEPTRYIVTDGKMVLVLESDEEGGYTVTSPYDPALITQAETIEEAFEMARDAAITLEASGRKSARTQPRRRTTVKSTKRKTTRRA